MRGGRIEVVDSPELKAARRHPVSLCKDDDCTTDAACGADRVCACGTNGREDHNRCVFGNCTRDADCAGFACVEDLALGIPSQPEGTFGVIGKYCRSAVDTCATDDQCSGVANGEQCVFTDGAFRCAIPR
jgi:hypothetical protein